MSDESNAVSTRVSEERRRELAVEHLLFGTIRYVEQRHPGLVDELEASLSHLGDMANGADKDDEAVREIGRHFLQSLRRAQAANSSRR